MKLNDGEIKNLLREKKIHLHKHWGQNFLFSFLFLQKILEAADLKDEDVVLEIGAGLGNLTFELAEKVKRVIAIEKDKRLVEILKELAKEKRVFNLQIICGDILKKLKYLEKKILPADYKVVANIPYYLTSRLLKNILQLKNKPLLIVLTVQKEVAERICAKPPKMNLLAISVQFYAEAKIIGYISKKFFWPQPKVDSAIIKIVPKKVSFSKNFERLFFKIVRVGFSHPRKQLINNLSKCFDFDKNEIREWLLKNQIGVNKRAENLSLEEWQRLIKGNF